MERNTMQRLVATIGCVLIFLIVGCIILVSQVLDTNVQKIDVPQYVSVSRDVNGEYTFTLDVERMLWEEHLPNPPQASEAYPEAEALRTLQVLAVKEGELYRLETVSTSTDPKFVEQLKAYGIALKNTTWTWTSLEAEQQYTAQRGEPKRLSLPEYVYLLRAQDGTFTAMLDLQKLLTDCAFLLPQDPTQHSGYRAIMSLGVAVTETEAGYLLQATSTETEILNLLDQNGIRILDTVFEWSAAEMERRYAAQSPATPQPVVTAEPTQAPQEQTPADATAEPTLAPTQAPTATPVPKEGLESLYGFDQTKVREKIRAAKEAQYGSRLEEGKIIANYFAVDTDGTEHKNCFRIVYQITTSNGTEYLVCDAYDLSDKNPAGSGAVEVKTYTSSREAKDTGRFDGWKIHTLDGGSMVFSENQGKSPFDENGLVKAESLTEELTYAELWNIPQTSEFTLLQLLGYARNEMFAQAGHKYSETGNYYKHFSSYDWYKIEGEVTANELAEKWPKTAQNIKTIKYLEKLIREG